MAWGLLFLITALFSRTLTWICDRKSKRSVSESFCWKQATDTISIAANVAFYSLFSSIPALTEKVLHALRWWFVDKELPINLIFHLFWFCSNAAVQSSPTREVIVAKCAAVRCLWTCTSLSLMRNGSWLTAALVSLCTWAAKDWSLGASHELLNTAREWKQHQAKTAIYNRLAAAPWIHTNLKPDHCKGNMAETV